MGDLFTLRLTIILNLESEDRVNGHLARIYHRDVGGPSEPDREIHKK